MSYEYDPYGSPIYRPPQRQPQPQPQAAQPGFGVGDVVARITSFFGIRPCLPCERRRQWLNRHLWFGPRR